MTKNIRDKKVIFSFNNFANKSFNNYIYFQLKKKNHYLYTKNPSAKKFFPKNKIVMAKEYSNSIFEKFSSIRGSDVEKFYLILSLMKSSLIKKLLIIMKLFLAYLNLLPSKENLRRKNFNINKVLENFDEIYCDFRLNEIYTNHEINNYAIKYKKKINCFIFSWDNLFAGDVMNYANEYYVSSKYFKKTLSNRHKIDIKKIKIGKNFQLDYFKLKRQKKIYSNYIIYAFSHNSTDKDYFKEEIEILKTISQNILRINNKIKIIARPYPYDFNINYSHIKNLKNVIIQNYGKRIKIDKNKSFIYDNNLSLKKSLIKNCICVINVFTTFGIESALLDKPAIFYSHKIKRNFFQYLNCIDFKLKFMPHFKIVKEDLVVPKEKKELFFLLKNLINKKIDNKFYSQSKKLKKIFL